MTFIFIGTVTSNDRLTPESHFQDTRLIKISAQQCNKAHYEPGDVLIIMPHNLEESVDMFRTVCPHLDYDTKFGLLDVNKEAIIQTEPNGTLAKSFR